MNILQWEIIFKRSETKRKCRFAYFQTFTRCFVVNFTPKFTEFFESEESPSSKCSRIPPSFLNINQCNIASPVCFHQLLQLQPLSALLTRALQSDTGPIWGFSPTRLYMSAYLWAVRRRSAYILPPPLLDSRLPLMNLQWVSFGREAEVPMWRPVDRMSSGSVGRDRPSTTTTTAASSGSRPLTPPLCSPCHIPPGRATAPSVRESACRWSHDACRPFVQQAVAARRREATVKCTVRRAWRPCFFFFSTSTSPPPPWYCNIGRFSTSTTRNTKTREEEDVHLWRM